MRSNREKVAWGIAIVVAAGIVLPVVFGEPRNVQGSTGGDSWRNLIYDFQTLLTGIAAVLAAAITIRTMEKTDRQSERRHRELMIIQLRPDQLKVSRALHPQIEHLNHISFQFHDFDNVSSQLQPGTATPEWQWLTEVSKRYLPCFEEIDRVLNRGQFRDGVILFDGATTRYLDELTEKNEVTRAMLRRHLDVDEAYDPNDWGHRDYDDHFADIHARAFGVTTLTIALLARLIASLESVDQSYALDMR